MIQATILDVARATGARRVQGALSTSFTGVSTDTRSSKPGELFIALSGPNFDGNAFAGAAVEGGAAGVMLRGADGAPPLAPDVLSRGTPILVHPDPRRALSDLAAWHRSRLAAAVVGVTGSCGKTTTKNILLDLCRAALGADPGSPAVVASPNSFNNDIGVPHTLFLAGRETEVCVVEMGTNHPGEIEALCKVARPSAGVVTNVGAAHLEGLGSIGGVAAEKASLARSLPREGFCVLNADSPWARAMQAETEARAITFSVEGEGDLDATDVWFHPAGTTFRLGEREVTSPLLGLHNVQNLLAALCACRGLGLDLERVLPHVSRLKPSHRRLEPVRAGGITLIDDSYNANPESARASVRVLAGLHGHGRRVLVLGDMLELGELAPELHHAIGVDAARSGIDLLIAVGELGAATAAGALEGGLRAHQVVHLLGLEEALAAVPDRIRDGDAVLIKGSRRNGLERLVQHLIELRRGDAA